MIKLEGGIHFETNLIYADPAWTFKTFSDKGKGRSPENHYTCSSFSDLKNIPVEQILTDDAIMFMWTTGPMLNKSFELANAWGFPHYSGSGFVWIKTNKDGSLFTGLGYTTRKNAEFCLIFKRGKGIKRVDKSVREVIMSRREKHSKKPDEAYERIEKLYGDNLMNPTELFARQKRHNWWSWGNEINSDFEFE